MNTERAINLGKIAARDGLGIMATAKLIEEKGGDTVAQEAAVNSRRMELIELAGGMGYRTAPRA